ncbi:PAS domain S-box protein [Sphingomonas sp. PB2P12]
MATLAVSVLTFIGVRVNAFERICAFVAASAAWQLDAAILAVLMSGTAACILLGRQVRNSRRDTGCGTTAGSDNATLAGELAERLLLQETARANAQQLESILAIANQSIVTIDGHGMIRQWNKHAELSFGWPANEVIGRPLSEVIVPIELRAAHDAGLARFMASKSGRLIGSRVEVEALRRNGSTFPIELALSATNVGKDWQFTALIQDISERRAQIELFENAFDHAPISMALVALDGRMMKLNTAFLVLIDRQPDDLEPLNFRTITHPDDLERDLQLMEQLIAGKIPSYRMEKRYIRKNGSFVWVRLSVSLVLHKDGSPNHLIAQVQDLSVEREAEDRYRLLADSASDMVGLYSMDGRCMYMSPSTMRILGYEPKELVGETALGLALIPPGERAAIIRALQRLRGEPAGSIVTGVIRLRHKDDRLVHIEFTARIVNSDNGDWRIVSASRDVTSRIKAQMDLEERSEELIRANADAERLAAVARQAQELFEGVFNNASDLNFVYDVVDGSFTIAIMNEAAGRSLATTIADARGSDLDMLFSPARADETRRELFEVVATGKVRHTIEQDPTTDTTFDVRLVPLRDDMGRVMRVFVSKRDISVLKRAEQAALKTNVLMRSAEKMAHMGYVTYDLVSQTMTWSDEIWSILGLNSETNTPSIEAFAERRHPDDRARSADKLNMAISRGLSEYDNDYRLMLPNGEIRHVMTRGTIHREGGVAVSVFGVLVDISKLKRAEEKARESDQRYRLMAENATDVIVTSDMEGRTTFVSSASVIVTGHTSEERLGGRVNEIAHPDDIAELRETFRALRNGAVGKHVRWRAWHKLKEEWVWLESSPALLRDPTTQMATGYLDVIRDVTMQKEQEDALAAARLKAENAMHSKERFLANMSHELRTPLNSIIGFSRLLNESPGLEPEDQRRVRLVHNAGLALHAVVDNVLDFSKLEADKLALHCGPFNVADFFTGTVSLLEPQAATRDVCLRVEIDPKMPDWLVGDMGRLRQILLNLLSNAVKFTQDGSVTTRVILTGTRHPDAQLRVEVTDTGGGIPQDKIATLFNRFAQASAATAVQYGGTGLGLAISRQLLTLMGGEIGVFSTVGKGSTFWFELALPVVTTLTCDEAMKPGVLSLEGKHILVVDDVDLNRELMVAMLSKYGCKVDLAENGVEALAAMNRHSFDMVLMDCQMPIMDGFAATRAIRAVNGPTATTPIIALTASAQPEHLARCREAGMDEHLTKPLDPGALESVLNRFLNSIHVPDAYVASGRPMPDAAPQGVAMADDDQIFVLPETTCRLTDGSAERGPSSSLRDRYMVRRAETLEALDSMIRAGLFTNQEIAQVAKMAHNLAGTAGMFGEAELGDAAAALEVGLEHWNASERPRLVEKSAATMRQIADDQY